MLESSEARALAALVRTLYAIDEPAARAKSSAVRGSRNSMWSRLQIGIHLLGRNRERQPPRRFLVRSCAGRKCGAIDFNSGMFGKGFAIHRSRRQGERESECVAVLPCGEVGDRNGNDRMPRGGIAGRRAPCRQCAREEAKREGEKSRRRGSSLHHRLHHGVRGCTG